MVRCPECHKDDLQQQLNHYYFNCLNCGKWFQVKEREDLRYYTKNEIAEIKKRG